jgi:hypothetical protein
MKNKKGMIGKALLPLALLMASGAGTITPRAQQVPQGHEQNINEQQSRKTENLPGNVNVISNIYDDPPRLPFVGKNKKTYYSTGEMSRHKAKMKCKKYCQPKKRK